MTTRALLSRDRTKVRHTRGGWSMTFPAADLPKWLALYRRLRDRTPKHGEPGQFAEHYAPDVDALEAVARKLGDGQ